MKKIFFAFLLAATGVVHAASGDMALDRFPTAKSNDASALQNGARLFVNNCLNCHSATYVRYNRLTDLGLSEAQIKDNLMFAADKVGATMTATIDLKQAKEWFGAAPPDLSLIERSRASGQGTGADYLYTYLRHYYRDDARPNGWNNRLFDNVGMPHALWELQGVRVANFAEKKDANDPTRSHKVFTGYTQTVPGQMTALEYDNAVGDLVAFLHWMGEPGRRAREQLGIIVLLLLSAFTVVAWRLNAAYWKDVK